VQQKSHRKTLSSRNIQILVAFLQLLSNASGKENGSVESNGWGYPKPLVVNKFPTMGTTKL
jgi:hypothetical protein